MSILEDPEGDYWGGGGGGLGLGEEKRETEERKNSQGEEKLGRNLVLFFFAQFFPSPFELSSPPLAAQVSYNALCHDRYYQQRNK